jgi:hypothetical protein
MAEVHAHNTSNRATTGFNQYELAFGRKQMSPLALVTKQCHFKEFHEILVGSNCISSWMFVHRILSDTWGLHLGCEEEEGCVMIYTSG